MVVWSQARECASPGGQERVRLLLAAMGHKATWTMERTGECTVQVQVTNKREFFKNDQFPKPLHGSDGPISQTIPSFPRQ